MNVKPIVIVTGLGALNLACAGLMSRTSTECSEIQSGTACWPDGTTCMIEGQETSCGQNGYFCDDGEWDDIMTFCNPPPMPAEPPVIRGTACENIKRDQPCETEKEQCLIVGQETRCGLNGYECNDGKWDELMTFCNPPPLPAGQ